MPLFFSIFKENKEKGEKKEKKKKKIRIPKVPVVVSEEEEEEEEIDFFQIQKEMGFEKEMGIEKEKEQVKVSWINLQKFLFNAGIVFLSGELNRKKGKIILGIITYISVVHPTREVYLFLNNCVSGCLRTAITMHDAIQQLPRPGHTVGCGMNASVGSLILVSGHERLAQPHARIIIQKPEWIKRKNTNKRKKIENPQIKNPKRKNLKHYFDDYGAKKQFDILTEYVHEIFVGKTGQPYDIIQKDLQEKVVMSAKEAQDYGIIDRLTTDLKMQSLLREALLRNRNENFEENRDDTPGWG